MKPSLSAFTGFLIIVLIGLGTWQILRKGEKEALLETLAQSKQSQPIDMKAVSQPESFQALFAEGQFIPGKTIFLQSKTYEGKNGVYVLDVFQTSDGKYVLTQRGWATTEITSVPSMPVTIEGFVRIPSPPTYFQPENKAPTYFWIDLKALSRDLNLPLLPFYLVLKSSFDPRIAPTDPIPLPRNNHLGYAITWYLLAFLLLIMLLYGRNKRKH
jgi:surfeit locus 1 family protein